MSKETSELVLEERAKQGMRENTVREESLERPRAVTAVAVMFFIVVGFSILELGMGAVSPISIGTLMSNLIVAMGLMKMKGWARIWAMIKGIGDVIFTLFILPGLSDTKGFSQDALGLIMLINLSFTFSILIILNLPSVRRAFRKQKVFASIE
jgi:hypothetical protein